jgi:hypothetical protein
VKAEEGFKSQETAINMEGLSPGGDGYTGIKLVSVLVVFARVHL